MITKSVKAIYLILVLLCLSLNIQGVSAENTMHGAMENSPTNTMTGKENASGLNITTEQSPVVAPETVISQALKDRLVIKNNYIAVALNNSLDGTGRFGIKVTGGDPYRTGDEEQPLIYGFEKLGPPIPRSELTAQTTYSVVKPENAPVLTVY